MNYSTPERLMIIAHRPQKSGFAVSELYISYGLTGAILLQLSLEELILIENNKLRINHKKKTSNALHNLILEKISNSKKERKVNYWVNKLSQNYKKYKWIIFEDLAKAGQLKIEHKKFLGLFPYRKTYLRTTAVRNDMLRNVRNCILHRSDLNDDNVILLGLIEACNMHNIIAQDRQELKKIKKELKLILKESPIAYAVDATIKQVQAAVIGSIIASTAAVSVATSS